MARAKQTGSAALPGTWKLQSFTTEDLATGEKTDLFGAHPCGYLNYGPDKRMYAILLEENRTAPADLVPTDAERIALFNGSCAYAGTWSVEGDVVSHHVDASWNESWTGTIQLRRFRIDGKYLHMTTLPGRNPVTGKECISELVWVKVE
ncbi:lipocalin-like domain-containing protein [Paraburkholderia sp. CNPSo 3272]|uniref:lipocalin-like domain-containing protein n=1 Tax=Paraburkholderia sp. CNPSo 3272 TaxID=2940931 RepID=UPI0020B8485E|nr:lipocalin-like domain-containing protein [Paraburkholderia sp. CNPSo 3272]MCP3722532.1 lipocalin-like domain-containing protein [Paraburkholderia sp. CNPSo 3272]